MIIGICGGTGSGKTTVARRILENVSDEQVVFLQQDSYYRNLGDMPVELRHAINFDHPDALDNDLFINHVKALRAGEAIEMPVYDFSIHTRKAETVHIEPKPILIVEGILIFVDAALRGDSWPFRRIGEVLARSDFARIQPADALHELAVELGLPDLDDLADTMRLSGAEGAEAYDTLRGRSSSMRQARLSAELAQANAVGERMTIPVTLMGLSIALIVVVAVIMNLVVH